MTIRAIDMFAGFGGFTEGARLAGVDVVWAANHWPVAVAAHAAAHPDVAHVCQDVTVADWRDVPAYDLLLASPACQGHSNASRGKRRAYHDALRATAWAVIDCAQATRPQGIIVENVPQFKRWELYVQWLAALRALGYEVSSRIVRASHHRVPQRRDRLFVTATRHHVRPEAITRDPEPAFGPCIDWDVHGWRAIEDAKPGARERMIRAWERFGTECLSQHVTGHPGVGLDEPIRTITGQDHWVIVAEDWYRPLALRELAAGMGFRHDYPLPECSRGDAILGLGNAVCPPVARDVICDVLEGF